MQQGVQYVVSLQDLNVSSQLTGLESKAMGVDKSIQGINNTLRDLGIGFGLMEVGRWAKEWVEGAADFETSMVRIKNASANAADGIKNQFFINDEVDKFKLKLDESADAYGQFLFKIKNAGLAPDVTRKLYENILEVSTVSAIPSSEMAATVRNVGIMLGEGILEARHLRLLSYVHPQLVPFLAHAMGLKDNQQDAFAKILKENTDEQTAMQKLSMLMSGGKLTKMAIDSKVILQAFEDYKKSVEGLLPSSLDTLNHAINEIDTAWQRFRNETIMTLKPEIVAFIDTLKDWASWLKENKDHIIHIAENVATFVKYLFEYKAALFIINGAQEIYAAFMLGYVGKEEAAISIIGLKTAAIMQQTAAVNALTAAIERQMAIQAGGSGLVGYGGMALNTGTAAAEVGEGAATAGGLAAFGLSGGVLAAVGVVAAGWVLSKLGNNPTSQEIADRWHGWGEESTYDYLRQIAENTKEMSNWTINGGVNGTVTGSTTWEQWKSSIDSNVTKTGNFISGLGIVPDIHYSKKADEAAYKKLHPNDAEFKKIVPDTDKITGQHIITYNILHGGKIVGVEKMTNTVQSLNEIDEKQFAHMVAETITAVINDSQIHS